MTAYESYLNIKNYADSKEKNCNHLAYKSENALR